MKKTRTVESREAIWDALYSILDTYEEEGTEKASGAVEIIRANGVRYRVPRQLAPGQPFETSKPDVIRMAYLYRELETLIIWLNDYSAPEFVPAGMSRAFKKAIKAVTDAQPEIAQYVVSQIEEANS